VAENPNFIIFWTSAFCGVAIWQHTEKVEHGYTTKNLLYNGIKIAFVFQRLQGEIVHSNFVVHAQARRSQA